MMASLLVSYILLATMPSIAMAHTRLECPPPRSAETGEKVGPCDAPDDPSLPAYPLVANALNTITWLESIPHPGAPARFALSLDGEDAGFETCLLLDHVPHDEYSFPDFRDPLTWHRSSITLFIPDIYCERCHLQLMTVMSDEIHGVPANTTCVYGPAKEAGLVANASHYACPVVYHSCAPVSINGTVPRNEIDDCKTAELEAKLDWPFMETEEYSTYYWKGNPGIYNQTDHRLLSGGSPIENCSNFFYCAPEEHYDEVIAVPTNARYAALAGSCSAMVGMEVEDFVLGKLPDQEVFPVDFMDNHPADCDSEVCQSLEECFTKFCVDGVVANQTGAQYCWDPLVTTCDHCYPDSLCSSSMSKPGLPVDDAVVAVGRDEDVASAEKPADTDSALGASTSGASNRLPIVLTSMVASIVLAFSFM